ncbi:MAG TPA: hypothetical protein VFH59_11905 [Frateuria sp.]|uniref:hypothetical protein n=1 Tax=Frateuria sp. TaxID=2211372 RepID=UPI002D7EBCE6|nr:hypothetical protein [Frateuria sp.]HET6806135.1 hypothetical protein [Frateuria sp.]
MARPDDERSPPPAGVETGPQGGAGGVGGEPGGARLDAQAQDRPTPAPAGGPRRPGHASDKAQPGYRARPAGQSGVGEQDDHTSTLREPQGDGHYVATDRGDKPLRSG